MLHNAENLPHTCGIYKIENLINHQVYVGQSKDIYRRYHSHHKYDCYDSTKDSYNFQIYQAIRKYGEENFIIEVLELCEPDELNNKEIYWINYFDSFKNGYNATPGGQFWTPIIHSPEIEAKRTATRELNNSLKAENHPRAKLSNEEVWNLRQRYIDGESIEEIYEDYLSQYPNIAVFRRIILGKTYVSVGNIPSKEQIRYTNAKLTSEQVKEIRSRYCKGKTSYAKLAKEYNVTPGCIAGIIQGKSYQHVK